MNAIWIAVAAVSLLGLAFGAILGLCLPPFCGGRRSGR